MTPPAHIRLFSSAIWLKAFVAVVCLAIIALEGWRDWGSRQQELVRIRAEMTNLAKSLIQHVEDTLELADAILTDVVDQVEEDGASPAAIMEMDDFLTARIQLRQQFKSLTVYGEDGFLLSSSLPGHRSKVDVRDQVFFRHHGASRDGKWFFGPLIRDPLGSDWILTLSRRIDRPDGSFGGVAQISIPPRYFANFFGRFTVGTQGAIILFDANGTILSRYPYIENAIGTDQGHRPWFAEGMVSGSFELVSGLDGLPRLSGYQRNHTFPVGVLSAVGRDEALAHWKQAFLFRVAAVSLLVAVIGGLGWSLAAQLKRRERAEAELAVLATTDGLTGLANRRAFDRHLEAEWLRAVRENTALSLLLADIDQFKAYNDIYGHQAGDECLQAVAGVFSRAVHGPGSLVARYGGEEIAVLLPDTDAAGAAAIAENIRLQVEALAMRHDANVPAKILTISIGGATRLPALENSRCSAKGLVALADAALYRAKQEGRNRTSTTGADEAA